MNVMEVAPVKVKFPEVPMYCGANSCEESGDAVVHGETGCVIPCGDVGALARAIERLYRAPEECRRMGAAARRRMETLFTWDHFRLRLLEAYRVAMERR